MCGSFESLRLCKCFEEDLLIEEDVNDRESRGGREKKRRRERERERDRERSDSEVPLADLDNEMDALGCAVAKQK